MIYAGLKFGIPNENFYVNFKTVDAKTAKQQYCYADSQFKQN